MLTIGSKIVFTSDFVNRYKVAIFSKAFLEILGASLSCGEWTARNDFYANRAHPATPLG
jgi:hypothetical protein